MLSGLWGFGHSESSEFLFILLSVDRQRKAGAQIFFKKKGGPLRNRLGRRPDFFLKKKRGSTQKYDYDGMKRHFAER